MTTALVPDRAVIKPGRVSVIVPCYRVAPLVHRALESVLTQTYPDVEVVVVDDCSPDALEQALAPYQSRIVVRRHKTNQGVSAARNTGAACATGAILAFLDADDWWPPNFLETLAPQVEPGKVLCYDNFVVPEHQSASSLAPEDGPTLFSEANWTRTFLDWDTMDAIFQNAPIFKVLVTRADFERVGGYDTRFHGIEDFHFCVNLLAHRMRLDMTLDARGCYLVHSNSTIRMHNRDLAKQLQSVHEWQTMMRVMPLELTLSPSAAKICRAGYAYWTMLAAGLLIRRHLSEKQFVQMLSPRFLQAVLPSVPALAAHKTTGLLRKLRARSH